MLKNLIKNLKPSSTLMINETSKQMEDQGLANKGDEYVLEHMIPANYMRDAAYMFIVTGDNQLFNQEIQNYDVAIIPSIQKNDKSNFTKAEKIYNFLGNNNIDVLCSLLISFLVTGSYLKRSKEI